MFKRSGRSLDAKQPQPDILGSASIGFIVGKQVPAGIESGLDRRMTQ
jgi:hypothetical protein